MGRIARDARLETRAARLRLTGGVKHWRGLEQGLALGYRRPASGSGTWLVRIIDRPHRVVERRLGTADDYADADGDRVIDFAGAQRAARAGFDEWHRAKANGLAPRRGAYTIADAVADYLDDYRRRGGRDLVNMEGIVRAHILPKLGVINTATLTASQVRAWHRRLAEVPPMRRTRKTPAPTPRNFRVARAPKLEPKKFDISDPEARRRRQSRANRILTVLKAALNHAYREERIASDSAWRRVAPFEGVDTPRTRYLTEEEARRLVEACEPQAFGDLVRGALLTGARYGELAELRVGDLNADAGTLYLRQTKAGKPRHLHLTAEGRALFARLANGREAGATLLVGELGRRWTASRQARPLWQACERAGIRPPITFHGLRDTFASHLALRGVSLQVIARLLGHADSRITEKHYAHLASSHVAETLAKHGLSLGVA
ncbi:Site-specific recombinase XerD [Rhizobiales bacterium GAS113]|nr:Site-specific recombinase XerD [Rhizobiales bacterium GAS113]